MKKIFRVVGIAFVVVAIVATLINYRLQRPRLNLRPNHPDPVWSVGKVAHLLPTAGHDRILLKASFNEALAAAPALTVDGKSFAGNKSDTEGMFWWFDARGLRPSTSYLLALRDADGSALCDPWPLKTLPAPDHAPDKMRLLIYTCAGGHDVNITWFGVGPLPLDARTRLLNRGLSFNPDAVISNGDQIYWDLIHGRTAKFMGAAPYAKEVVGEFDRTKPVLGGPNEAVLKKAVGPQIALLYGTACRSVPCFFTLDDHDYFENDEARERDAYNLLDLVGALRTPLVRKGVSFPPDEFMLDLGRSAQKLYLPEFLPDPTRPADLPGAGASDRAAGINECFGSLRWGQLVELLMYDERRFISLDGERAALIHPAAENWIVGRMAAEETTHVVNVSPLMLGLSAGKWMEWYPDVRGDDRKPSLDRSKYMWQPGWFAQHDRLLAAASGMKRSPPLFICGDIHCQAELKILKSGDLDLSANPVYSIASSSLGCGLQGFPSKGSRGMLAQPPLDLTVEQGLPSLEKNGFLIVDFLPTEVVIQFFAWRPPEPVEAIDELQPHRVLKLKTRAAN